MGRLISHVWLRYNFRHLFHGHLRIPYQARDSQFGKKSLFVNTMTDPPINSVWAVPSRPNRPRPGSQSGFLAAAVSDSTRRFTVQQLAENALQLIRLQHRQAVHESRCGLCPRFAGLCGGYFLFSPPWSDRLLPLGRNSGTGRSCVGRSNCLRILCSLCRGEGIRSTRLRHQAGGCRGCRHHFAVIAVVVSVLRRLHSCCSGHQAISW